MPRSPASRAPLSLPPVSLPPVARPATGREPPSRDAVAREPLPAPAVAVASTRRFSRPAPKHVALIIESQVMPRRNMLTGVARYIQEHEPWAIYLKPFGVEKSLERWLNEWRGDGIIAAVNDPSTYVITDRGIPVVDVVGVLRRDDVPLVRTNDRAVGRLGAEHLLERGFRNFGFCEYADLEWSYNRRVGFVQTIEDRGCTADVHVLPLPWGEGGPQEYEQQQSDLANWLKRLPKPVGIMATNDLTGQRLLEVCLRLGIEVPDQVAVVGADNDEPVCRIATPALSSVIINDHMRGYEAASLLDRLMRKEPTPRERVLVEPAGVVGRASTDIMAIDDDVVAAAMRFLREHACDSIGVDHVVRKVSVSRSVLERRFRKVVGRSINQELVRLRINRAVELLTETSLALKVIASRSGFGTQAYMNAVFQAKVGRTPGSFR
jgi:LacI family transcriptional regulator